MSFIQLPFYVRYRWVLLLIAVLALVSGSYFASGFFGIAFVWFNGAFWAIELMYPYRTVANKKIRFSRIQLAPKLMKIYAYIFFGFYFSIACGMSYRQIKNAIVG